MIRLLAAVVATLALVAGTARADTWIVVAAPTRAALPSASVPNAAGSLSLPPGFESHATRPQSLGYGELEVLWRRAGAAYAVPWQVLAAINKIESNFGRNMGPSAAGAVGWMQFMPSTWLRWGVDADGDGVADPWNADDAVYAAARYLAAAGGMSDVRRAVFAYNHAQWYVDEVLALAQTYVGGGLGSAGALDQREQKLERARLRVLRANRRVVSAVRSERRLHRAETRLLRRIVRTPLLSDRLELQKRAAQVDWAHERARARVGAARLALAHAERTLADAERTADRSSFAPAARNLVAGATAPHDGYVFPVGGGPSIVSAGHWHHDYPAVDIAAPEGSPVYALAAATVMRAWHYPDPRCGIGMTVRTADGREWTYCHLAELNSFVHPGIALAAGQPVGLVGSTGHATGPHLHLQLQPPTEWPQQQAWFKSFAGSAFRWQGEAAPRETEAARARSGPVFQVVTTPEVVRFSP
jgi:murein DD-endopeptidase MepM/ murein hydrolase activator NlpD